ncbi:hypothetical protein AAFF_G00198450 [Aldrovandia affinis]|uniref:Cystatin domain-containing protein n=1 Tax=Aldrovandia affinis TaxID=143900 RepID=A0AAD7RIF3_9TELE|nr:hypothetical protein AAFF_G00198450 [Aldrovandia affinis]
MGGRSEASMDEQGVKDALQYAVVEHNKERNDLYISQVAKVVKVEKQVVAGIKYYFTVEMARTSCRKGGVEKLCAVHDDPEIAAPYECTFDVWSQPWIHSIVVTKGCNH